MLHIAILGAGGMGQTHIRNIQEIPGAKVTDICDPGPAAKALAEGLGAAWHASLGDMLAVSDAHIVLVCTPSFLHYGQIRSILQAGRHCICEKPLCLSAREGRALVKLAAEQRVQLYVAQALRFWEEYELLARHLREGRYGPLRDIWLGRLTQKPAWSAGNWMFDREKSGLIPFDLHVHDLDFLVSLLGPPKSFHVQRGGAEGAGHLEYYRVAYEYDDVTACIESSWYDAPIPFSQGYRAYFEQALLWLQDGVLTLYPKGGEPRRLGGTQPGVQTQINVTPTAAYRNELAHFFACAAENRPSEIVTHSQVLAVLDTLERIAEAGS